MSAQTPPPFGLSQIGQISIPVRDLPRAVAFYRDSLGIPFLFEVPRMAFFDAGGVRLLLGLPENAGLDHASSILYFKVPDIRQASSALQSRGVTFLGEPALVARMPTHDLWLAEFKDSEDNILALMCDAVRAS